MSVARGEHFGKKERHHAVGGVHSNHGTNTASHDKLIGDI
jgi:hypothetical protein